MDKRERIDERGDWEKALSSKFQDYEPATPDLPPLHIPERTAPPSRWRWLVIPISVAAAIIIALLAVRESSLVPENQMAISPVNDLVTAKKSVITSDVLTPKEPHLPNQQENRGQTLAYNNNDETMSNDDIIAQGQQLSEESREAIAQDGSNAHSERAEASDVLVNNPLEKARDNNQKLPPRRKRELKLSLFTSGTSLAMNATTISQINDGLYTDKTEEYNAQVTPVFEIGSTLLFPLAQRWALQSGLKYSWYRIDVKSNRFLARDNHTLDVHSLGVPLDIQYTFYHSNAWSMYGQYGISLNIPLKSTIRNSKSTHGGATISLDTSFALGLEYRITKNIGLYSSFGVSYDILQMRSNLPDADISRWHGKVEAGIRFRINR